MSAAPRPRPSLRVVALRVGLAALALLVLIQLVPYGRDHDDPPVTRAARLDPGTRAIVAEACADCHSNRTRWPWYTNVAPASWFAQSDVDGGRETLNFSEWDLPQREAGEAAEEVQKGKMPMPIYLPLHPDARLTADERQALVRGLQATVANDRPRRR